MNVTSNVRQVVNQMRRAEPAVRAATRRTLNKVGQAAFTLTLRTLSREIGLSQTKLRPYVTLNRAGYIDLSAAVRITPHTFNIASFNGRQTRRGVSSAAWGKRRVYPHTFLIQGGKTAMVRITKRRLPIRPVYGPRIHREFARADVETALQSLVRERWDPTLRHELAFAMGRIGARPS